MVVSEIQLYEALAEHLGKEKAQTLVKYVEQKIEKEFDYKKDIFSTKQDIITVKEEIAQLEVRLSRTMYIVGVGQFLAIIGSVIAVMKFLH